MKIEFIASPSVFLAKPQGGMVAPGTWEFWFFVTHGVTRCNVARCARASAEKNRQQAIDEIAATAEAGGYTKLEIFSVTRIVKQWISEN